MSTSKPNTKQLTVNIKNFQANQSPKKLASKNLRFPQAKLLVLIIRRIIHSRIRTAYDKVRTAQRPKYNYLNKIQTIWNNRKRDSFLNILTKSKHEKLLQLKSKTSRVNIRIFLFQMLERLHKKKLKVGFIQISNFLIKNNLLTSKVTQFAILLQKMNYTSSIQYGWKKILSICQKRRILTIRMVFFQQIFHKIYNKTIKCTLQTLFVHSSHIIYENLFISSQSKRKLCYDAQNNRRQLVINERQNIYNLKQMVQNEAYDKNVKNAQMKRDRAIKISQTQQKIKNLEREIESKQIQVLRAQKNANKIKQIIEKRANLSKRSNGALEKVHSLFNDLKYEQEIKISLRSSSFIGKIVLNKEKFKSLLKQYNQIKDQTEDFQIYNNITNRNLICVYENVQIDNLKQSKEYQIAFDEHTSLSQCLNSLLCYHLLKDKGDCLLKQNNLELECLFEKLFGLMEDNQNGQMDQDVRSSIKSLKSSKILKKRPSLKVSSIRGSK